MILICKWNDYIFKKSNKPLKKSKSKRKFFKMPSFKINVYKIKRFIFKEKNQKILWNLNNLNAMPWSYLILNLQYKYKFCSKTIREHKIIWKKGNKYIVLDRKTIL